MGPGKGRAREGEKEKIERGLKRHLGDGGNTLDSGLLSDSNLANGFRNRKHLISTD